MSHSDASYESSPSVGDFEEASQRGRDPRPRIISSSHCIQVHHRMLSVDAVRLKPAKAKEQQKNQPPDLVAGYPDRVMRFDGAIEAWLETLPSPEGEVKGRPRLYKSLNDASTLQGLSRKNQSVLLEGNGAATIWYFTSEFLERLWPEFMNLNTFEGSVHTWRQLLLDMKRGIDATHAKLGQVHCPLERTGEDRIRWLDVLFGALQMRKWCPLGESRELLSKKHLSHSSMAVGDAVQVGPTLYLVTLAGFVEVEDAAAILPPESIQVPDSTVTVVQYLDDVDEDISKDAPQDKKKNKAKNKGNKIADGKGGEGGKAKKNKGKGKGKDKDKDKDQSQGKGEPASEPAQEEKGKRKGGNKIDRKGKGGGKGGGGKSDSIDEGKGHDSEGKGHGSEGKGHGGEGKGHGGEGKGHGRKGGKGEDRRDVQEARWNAAGEGGWDRGGKGKSQWNTGYSQWDNTQNQWWDEPNTGWDKGHGKRDNKGKGKQGESQNKGDGKGKGGKGKGKGKGRGGGDKGYAGKGYPDEGDYEYVPRRGYHNQYNNY
mmetsp:Transcript_36705/g.84464  ORF Transcript_36705/g.84464 Transcript_36705/m.84464 type:complete len:540 (+) Transcript_36705:61-1680(+)